MVDAQTPTRQHPLVGYVRGRPPTSDEENSQAQTIDNNDKENEDHSTMRTLHGKNRPRKAQYSLVHQDTTESTDGITNGCPRQLRQPLETIDTNKPNYPTILLFTTANPNSSVASSITSSTEHGGGQNVGNRNVSKHKLRRAAHIQKHLSKTEEIFSHAPELVAD